MRLHPSKLATIESSHMFDNEACLSETLTEFLKKNYDHDKSGVPSWKLIVAAVAHQVGGRDKALALKLAKEHPASSGKYSH